MVKPLSQRYRHDPKNGSVGDCWPTALAMVMGVDRDTIPHFAKIAMDSGDEPGAAVHALRDWLAPQGLGLMQMLFPPETTMLQLMETLAYNNPNIPFMVLGQSPRGDWGHVVVALDGNVADPASGAWLDDPAEALSGPVGDWWWVECIVKLPKE